MLAQQPTFSQQTNIRLLASQRTYGRSVPGRAE